MSLRQDNWDKIEDRVRSIVRARDDFVRIPFPLLASVSNRQLAAAVESYKREAAIVDARLAREVSLQFKATALSDICSQLRGETGIHLSAGSSVADEKVTILCEKMPLRDVMRQLGRPFGYTWLRSGKEGELRYELVQDLRSQLLEEELRNRDRNGALLALEREIQRYRPYLDLSPDEALAKAKTAPAAEKPLLEKLAGSGWGLIHIYFRLSNPQLVALRAGQELIFRQEPNSGEQPLPQDLRRGILQSFRSWHVHTDNGLALFAPPGTEFPDNVPVATVPEVQATIHLTMTQSELGQYTLDGHPELSIPGGGGQSGDVGPWASGRSPAVLKPDNRADNQKLAGDPVLRPRMTLQPQPSCRPAPATVSGDGSVPEPKVTSADVLEALHRASGLPIVSDYYTRLYALSELSVCNLSCFEALHQLADKMRLRWAKDGRWLQFRSASYYDDRLKEVPNRLLARWSAARRQRGSLSLDELVEIAQLPDAQLDGKEMAEGARECWGLTEWDLPCSNGIYGPLRTHLRYLATFTPEQRRLAMRTEGIPFTRMSLAQQQQFVAFATFPQGEPPSLQELQGASMRVDYSQPGGFQWGNPAIFYPWWRWVVIVEYGREGRWAARPMLRGRTREEVMQAVLRLDPTIRQNAVHAGGPRPKPEPDPTPLEAQIFPTKLSLVFLYFPTASNAGIPRIVGPGTDSWQILY